MKKILGLLFIAAFISCETPYQITETITKDSTGKETHVITKTYANGTTATVPHASVNVMTSPLLWGYGWGSPFYYPNYSPRIVVPIHPIPHYMPRGGRH